LRGKSRSVRDMSPADARDQVTQLLQEAGAGHPQAAQALLPIVYDELRKLAGGLLGSSGRKHTLQPTALVHEAYLKLVHWQDKHATDRQHFFAVAAMAMRQVLVNYARDKRAQKRGGPQTPLVTLDCDGDVADRNTPADAVDILALEAALADLERTYPKLCRIVELKFFAGLTNEQTAELLNVTTRTIERDWRMAKAELLLRLRDTGGAP
jgi:RNA polymerase sigma factor (TIGR02999 family)